MEERPPREGVEMVKLNQAPSDGRTRADWTGFRKLSLIGDASGVNVGS